jgi:hypothetical protein
MAIVVVNEMQGADQSVYDTVTSQVLPEDKLPAGCRLHVAGPVGDGWRVITVWDSEEQFQDFRDNMLVPAIQDSGFGDRVAPNIATNPAYKVITA